MSIAQTYFLAHKARAKLSSEAARPDHNLRLLVGHANLLDSLMLELADAEREQESWFNQSVRGASRSTSEERHIQWADTIAEEPEHDWQAEDAESDSDSSSSDSDSDSDFDDDEEDVEMADAVSLRRIPSHTMLPHKAAYGYRDEEEDYDMDDSEEDYAQLALHRSPSHSASSSPPELDDDSDSTEDESMPPSPPTTLLPTFEEPQKGGSHTATTTTTTDLGDKTAFYEEGYYLPPRNPARLVSAISVY
ncbi:430f1f8a-dc69-46e2-b89d-129eaae54845 [Thermothielavioides terrestris]|nr:430f1f8a-dc69-46e2-b89d-129eaae54845 [Thermothielavioides terrestris]